MNNITANNTKSEIVTAAMEFVDATDETIAELRAQRAALLIAIAVLTVLLTF